MLGIWGTVVRTRAVHASSLGAGDLETWRPGGAGGWRALVPRVFICFLDSYSLVDLGSESTTRLAVGQRFWSPSLKLQYCGEARRRAMQQADWACDGGTCEEKWQCDPDAACLLYRCFGLPGWLNPSLHGQRRQLRLGQGDMTLCM